jgi:hypothetical protein
VKSLMVSRVARALLIVHAISFLSPQFAWAMHAAHHELAHGATVAAAPGHRHGGGDAHDDHSDPHASLGHVLGHIPGTVSSPSVASVSAFSPTLHARVGALRPAAVAARLDRPPRTPFLG